MLLWKLPKAKLPMEPLWLSASPRPLPSLQEQGPWRLLGWGYFNGIPNQIIHTACGWVRNSAGLRLLFCCSLQDTSKLLIHSMSRTGLVTEIHAFITKIQSKRGKILPPPVSSFIQKRIIHLWCQMILCRAGVQPRRKENQQDAADGQHKPTADPASVHVTHSHKEQLRALLCRRSPGHIPPGEHDAERKARRGCWPLLITHPDKT